MKAPILKALRKGGYISGEELAQSIGISRTAIWKYVNQLRKEGYQISSSPRKGYSLVSPPENPLPEEIKEGLKTNILGKEIAYYRQVSSTQATAKILAAQGATEGTVVIAESQLNGRGRIGRAWVSPPGGIYLSIILRPNIKPSEALRFPLITGVGVVQAIEKVTKIKPRLKWPNDILLQGKKVGGILTELSAEVDRLNYIVIGIGINANNPKSLFPEELQGIATSLTEECGEQISRVKLVQAILVELEALYEDLKISGFQPIREKWKGLSDIIGSRVRISSGGEEVEGEAIDIDQDGALILRKADDSQERFIAGEVSLRC
jgi:BirA family biotin operon repressor/biotin-[acetyl-CoA-carboxylase] ligase